MRDPRSILITGASSGIGAALAKTYARAGRTLLLTGRHDQRLAGVADDCRRRGAEVREQTLDVTDAEALAAWMEAEHAAAPLELVIANAGISAGTGGAGESAQQARGTFAVNLDGVVNTVQPALTLLQAKPHPADGRPRGQIAIMASLASFRGFAGAPAYCGSKAAVRVYGEGLRAYHARDGIEVSVICPGFVGTPMTDVNKFPMPFVMEVDRAARIVARGLERNRGRIAFPWPMYALAWIIAALPPGLTDRLVAALPRKDATA